MRLFRTIYKAFLLATLAALGYVTFLFMTPVTQGNLESRVTSLCTVGNIATQIDRKYKLTGLSQKDADCGCLSRKLLQTHGKAEAARLADATRQLFVNAMHAKLTRSAPSFEGIDRNDLQTIQQFFETVGATCTAKA
jgi:hypothetical protein